MIRKSARCWAITTFLLLPLVAIALIPPLSQAELQEQSDLVVEGVVSRIDKVGKVFHDRCYGWQKNNAVVLLEHVIKGKKVPTSILVEYDTRVINTKKCIGGKDTYTLEKGQRYRMYLKSSPGQTMKYYFFNWAGLKRK